MRTVNETLHEQKRIEILEKSYDCYAKYGLNNVGIKGLAKACGCSSGNLYSYFKDLDDLIIQSCSYCMKQVEEDFIYNVPETLEEL